MSKKTFQVLEQKLSDNSPVYCVRFFLDSPITYVDLQCLDQKTAEDLADELERGVSYIEGVYR